MKTYLAVLLFGVFLFSGCEQSNSKKSDTNTDQTVTKEEQVNNAPESSSDNGSDTPKPAKAATGLNPAHGQPGHDCAIPVGAPLNSKNNSSPMVNPGSSSPMVNPGSSSPLKAAQGTNPAHGQPGHDCAIPVGAPLNK
ncbi:hypothetical protein OS188_09375 [Xanthomarina sp. F1114]|uniref:hypothetical protein n=1 Tax=Xanthomarina sp. F1114 TaxID=2996019 RepID=UPI00225DD0BC|nr:hypothetical protein [Xanthomarina sp. F1114]MCX7548163.1 hypothetical protein [Xanthomarina sp. F1114]